MINQAGFGLTPTTYNNAFSSTVTQFQQPYEQSKFNTALNQTVGYGNSALSSGIASAASSVIQDGTKSLGQGFVNGLGSFTNGASLGGLALNVASGLIGNKTEYSGDKGAITQGLDSIYDTLSDGAAAIPGAGTAISLGMKGLGVLNKALNKWTGSGTSGMTNTDAILGSNFLGLTPIGLINGWGGKNAYTMMKDSMVQKENLGNMWNAYGSTLDLYQDAQHKAGKKYGYFSSDARKKANKIITRAALAREDLLDMNRQRETGNIRAGMTDANISKYALALNGGYQPLAVGRHGFKFQNVTPTKLYKLTKADKDKIKEIVKRAKNKEYKFLDVRKEDIHNWDKLPSDAAPVAYQNGGVFNLIPEGALHARKHHMEDDENITKKGIPVVDNNGKQQAEIECNEIIFRKEVTDKIEQLSEDGSDDAAIECGKLLSIEIMENTQDRTNLIPKAQNGMSFNQWNQLSVPQQVSALSVDPKLNTTPSVLSDVQSKTKQSALNKYNTKQALVGMGVSLVDGLINTFNSQKEADAKRKQAQEQQYNQMIQNSMTQEQLLQRQRQTLANEYAMKEINGPTFNSNMVW